MSENNRLQNRLVDVELQLMHLQKDYESLNDVVLQHGRRIDELLVALKRLADKNDATDGDSGAADLADEKPPHY